MAGVQKTRAGAQAPVRFTTLDEWTNALTGLGQLLRDKKTASTSVYRGLLTQQNCEEIYASDSLHRKIAEKLPKDATRRWLELELPKTDDALEKRVQDEQDRLQIRQLVRKAWTWARVYGGACIFINTGEKDEALAEPLELKRIPEIKSLVVLHRWELWCGSTNIEQDISEPVYGYPRVYELRPQIGNKNGIKIHHSRLIRFDGEELPELLRRQNNYWHDSVFTGTYTALRNYGMSISAAASLLSEFRQLYYSVRNLATTLGAGKKDLLRTRLEAQNLARSLLGTFLLDLDEEKMESASVSLSGFAETMELIKLALQASTDMPHTILFNESPSGLGATGRSEQEVWYDYVHGEQENYLALRLDPLFEAMFAAKNGPTKGTVPDGWTYEFKPLWEPSEKERAETKKTEAETDQIYVDMSAKDPSEVREDRFPELGQMPEPDPALVTPVPLPMPGAVAQPGSNPPAPPATPAPAAPRPGAGGRPEA